ncbi:MAG TPA: hypothetical protein VEC37_10170, partial [Bacillota bacterium]|nr:hypothetical protein [Bacillota bacterium]
MLSCEVSLLPLETANSDQIINESVEALKKTGIKHEVGNQSTYMYSQNPEDIWKGLRAVYDVAQKNGTEFSMVINL